jgi:Alr-MurF fusion protein
LKYSLQDIASIVKGELISKSTDVYIEHLLTDSRKLSFPSDSLFFALQGPRRNGHQFIGELFTSGVKSFVVSERPDTGHFADANFVVVKDVLVALQALTAWHRKQFNIPVIGITGSNGKTIVKEWLNQLLESRFQVVRSPKSYNSQIGVPLSVWQLNRDHQIAIFEAGISESGEMDKLEKVIQPTIGVFTNIGEAHSEGFVNIRQKINEKMQLFKNVKTLIYCKDYPSINEGVASYIRQLYGTANKASMEFFSWSAKTEATVTVQFLEKTPNYTSLGITYQGQQFEVRIPFADDASVENAITCICVMLQLGIEASYMQQALPALTPVAMRLEMKKGINNCSIINDSYSVDISSLKIALDFLTRQQHHTKKTVILSDLLETGKNETELYAEIALLLAHRKIQRLIGIGKKISKQQAAFKKLEGIETHFYPDVETFRKEFYLLSFANETILLKGARIFEFEQISQLLEQKIHQTVLEIDQHALLHNLKQFQHLLKPSTRVMAMVKAFSYGSGSYEIASILQFHKVDYLAVAYADEGVELRKGGIKLPVMVMNAESRSFDALLKFNLQPVIYSFEMLHQFDAFLKKEKVNAFPVHIEIETGMNRLGFAAFEIAVLVERLKESNAHVESVFTHLVASEDPEQDAFTLEQAAIFEKVCEQLKAGLEYPFLRHIDNSAGTARHPDLQMDMVRLGIGLYGIDASKESPLDLQEVTTLKTTIAQIKSIRAGETVGYGRQGRATRDLQIATVRIGYADGYPRRLGNGKGKMLVKGHLAPVIGNICMDMTMIDITDIPFVNEGDDVIVFGKELSLLKVAEWAETIPYEIMTGISQRVKRIYFEES